MTTLTWLRLMQLTDSALPIGTLAHSYGLETLVDDRALTVDRLQVFLQDFLMESGRVEATYCRKAYQMAFRGSTAPTTNDGEFDSIWLHLNSQLDALKIARESREASATLGRRFLQLATKLEGNLIIEQALLAAKKYSVSTHYCTSFGLVCGILDIDQDFAVVSFLQQFIMSLVSACQRLMPLGQTEASRLIWQLKPAMIEAAQNSVDVDMPFMFTTAVEVGSMRHPDLGTRLFIS